MAKIKRMNLCVVKTILQQIQTHGKSKRTNLALVSKLPYDRFSNYLHEMLLLELVLLETTVQGIYVMITDRGRKFIQTHSCNESL